MIIFLTKCVSCIARSIVSCVKYLNAQTLTQVALSGTNYIQSANIAAILVKSKAKRFSMLGTVGGILYGICRMIICVSSFLVIYHKFKFDNKYVEDIGLGDLTAGRTGNMRIAICIVKIIFKKTKN